MRRELSCALGYLRNVPSASREKLSFRSAFPRHRRPSSQSRLRYKSLLSLLSARFLLFFFFSSFSCFHATLFRSSLPVSALCSTSVASLIPSYIHRANVSVSGKIVTHQSASLNARPRAASTISDSKDTPQHDAPCVRSFCPSLRNRNRRTVVPAAEARKQARPRSAVRRHHRHRRRFVCVFLRPR